MSIERYRDSTMTSSDTGGESRALLPPEEKNYDAKAPATPTEDYEEKTEVITVRSSSCVEIIICNRNLTQLINDPCNLFFGKCP